MRITSYKLPLLILLLIAAGHYVSTKMSWYWLHPETDIILHGLAGIMFGLFWLNIAKKKITSKSILLTSALAFSVFASVGWEMWEFGTYQLESQGPIERTYYDPSLSDALQDILSSFVGAAATLIVWRGKK